MGLWLHGSDSGIVLGICTSMDGSLVMIDLNKVVHTSDGIWLEGRLLSPQQSAEYVFKSKELLSNPFKSGSIEFKLFVDRLLELTSEAIGND